VGKVIHEDQESYLVSKVLSAEEVGFRLKVRPTEQAMSDVTQPLCFIKFFIDQLDRFVKFQIRKNSRSGIDLVGVRVFAFPVSKHSLLLLRGAYNSLHSNSLLPKRPGI